MLQIIGKTGNDEIANVYLGKTKNDQCIEFVESIQPPIPRKEKWVLIISTLFGCPIACPICDAGGCYKGKLSTDEILAQIDFLIAQRFPDKKIPCKKLKIQFARMGEPTLNHAVLEALRVLPTRYNAPGILPSLSTVAPSSSNDFFDELIAIKNRYYALGNFQLQFSIHTTDQILRDKIIPIKKWNFSKIANYGAKFRHPKDRKITLNFALAKNYSLSIDILKRYFDPEIFIIKITPINPTLNAVKHNIESYFTVGNIAEDSRHLIEGLRKTGFEVILSIGELEENKIGSNCGQYVKKFLHLKKTSPNKITEMYTYEVKT